MNLRVGAVRLAFVGVALLAACGGDDSGALSDAEYSAAVRAISERRLEETAESVEAITNAFETLSPEGAVAVLAEQLPAVIAAVERANDEMNTLSPPQTYAADHDRLLEGWRDEVATLRRIIEAAEARDFLRVQALQEERLAISTNLTAALSAAFREFAFTSEDAEFQSATFGGLQEERDGVRQRAARRHGGVRPARAGLCATPEPAVQQHRLVLRRTAGAGAGTAFEAAQTVIEQIDAPPGYEDDHQRVLRYLDEAVRLDREVGRSIEERDIVLFAVSNIGLGRNGGLTALDVAPSVCAVLGSPARLCRVPDELPGGEYGALLYPAMREFSARFGTDRQLQAQLNLLSFISDDELFGLVAAAVPDLKAIVMDVRETVSALEPASGMEADHERLLQFFRADARHAAGHRGRGDRLGPRCRAQRQSGAGWPAS